jgi:S-adenosylmethionine decarboxylase
MNNGKAVHVIGRHLFADLFGVDASLLTDEARLVEMLLTALRGAGFNVISHISHGFPGELAGVTGIALLSESHASFHTYPEHEYVAVDVFSCGSPSPDEALASMVAALQPRRVQSSTQPRGGVSNASEICLKTLE